MLTNKDSLISDLKKKLANMRFAYYLESKKLAAALQVCVAVQRFKDAHGEHMWFKEIDDSLAELDRVIPSRDDYVHSQVGEMPGDC